MPQIIEIGDAPTVMAIPKTLRTPPLAELKSKNLRKAISNLEKRVSLKKAARMLALSARSIVQMKYVAAANLAVSGAVQAAASFRENPPYAVRIIQTARNLVRTAINGARKQG